MIVEKQINGKLIADTILEDITYDYSKDKKPCKLVVVSIGEDSASNIYVNNKKKACEKVGFQFEHKQFSNVDRFEPIYKYLQDMNDNEHVYGIIIQLPIKSDVLTKDEIKCLTQRVISKEKDVDGFLEGSPCIPCTPKGIIKMLDTIRYDYKGKTALIIGRSDIVGKPLAKLLLNKDCTVIQAHSKTPKEKLLRMFSFSDVVISAVGKPNLITDEDVNQYFKDNRYDFYGDFKNKKDRIIIDVGINKDENDKLCGDFSESFKENYSEYYTPVPGGVGPMTVAMLIENLWERYNR